MALSIDNIQSNDKVMQMVNAEAIMQTFAYDTGLIDPDVPRRRYLWSDVFAVCNFIDLYRQTDKPDYLELAKQLVDQVHESLGKNRQGDSWLSGPSDTEAKQHPTQGGLRIGEKLNERQPREAFDSRLEWDRDGQYFHYLTKWMQALDCLSRVTSNRIYNQWAIELAKVAHRAFTYTPAGSSIKRMVWKMSIDLKRPLVDSMGQHDPLDGLITYQQLEATEQRLTDDTVPASLETENEALSKIASGRQWTTEDPLSIGGLLTDANRMAQLIIAGHCDDDTELDSLLQAIDSSLQQYVSRVPLNTSAEHRLAFRKLGLAIGIYAIKNMCMAIEQYEMVFPRAAQLQITLRRLVQYYPVYEYIRDYWLFDDNRSVQTWSEHGDINNVMLATCLAPESYLTIL